MTREQLDAIRARVESGTARGLSTQIEIDRDGTTRWVNLGPYPCHTNEDAAQVRDLVTFIHASPTDLRALLAEVERLRDAHAMAVQVSGELCERCGWAMKFPGEKCRCELLAEVERLTAELHRMKSRPVEAEFSRLDTMWQQLVRERDEAVYELRRLKAEVESKVAQNVALMGQNGRLQQEVERLIAERDAAFARGVAAMREAAVAVASKRADLPKHSDLDSAWCRSAECILDELRHIPIPEDTE